LEKSKRNRYFSTHTTKHLIGVLATLSAMRDISVASLISGLRKACAKGDRKQIRSRGNA
jgi:CO/xanthine dehydrogenase FAD-binding subunit